MTLYKTGDYTVFDTMPVHVLNELINWRVNYEKAKREAAEKEIENRKSQSLSMKKK